MPCAPDRQRIAEHRGAECLRRLRQEDLVARQRGGDEAGGIRALHRVVARTRGDRRRRFSAAASMVRLIRSADTSGRAAS